MPIRRLRPNRRHEAELWAEGHQLVAGLDEVGRGAWAGPLVAAAVILPQSVRLPGVRDSKLLSRDRRDKLVPRIKRQATAIGVGWASPVEIDQFGLSWALQQAGWRALSALGQVDVVLLDGQFDYLAPEYRVKTVIKADRCCLSVAAASIVAKVARDNYMTALHRLHPAFGFDTNVGYGTRHHQRALLDGLTPQHRRSFAPIGLAAGGYD